MQLSLLDFRTPPAPVPPPAPPAASSPTVETTPTWLEPDSAEGRYAAWLMCDERLVAVVYETTGADGISDGDTATVVLWQGERVAHRMSVPVRQGREMAEAEARRLGLA